MQVRIDKSFPIDAPAERAWELLSDVAAVAGCMPGAEITEQLDASHYKGRIRVRLGPATMQFKGDIEVSEVDAGAHRIRLIGKGADVKGSSGATLELTATAADVGGKTELVGVADVGVTGKLASLGGRMLSQASDQLIGQFAANFAARVEAPAPAAADATGSTAARQSATAQPSPPEGLNGLAFLWRLVVDLLKGLFKRRSGAPR